MVTRSTGTQGSALMGKDAADGDEYKNTRIQKYRNTETIENVYYNAMSIRQTEIQG